MEDIKTHAIETSAVADPIGERADNQNTAADQQTSFQGSAIRPSSSNPSRRLRQWPRRQLQFGPALADGYATESAMPVKGPRQRREGPTPTSPQGLSQSSHSPGHK